MDFFGCYQDLNLNYRCYGFLAVSSLFLCDLFDHFLGWFRLISFSFGFKFVISMEKIGDLKMKENGLGVSSSRWLENILSITMFFIHGIIIIIFTMKIVEPRTNSRYINDDFEHLVAHTMSCTLENGAECAMGKGVLRFWSLDQVLSDDDLMRIMERKVKHGSCFGWQQTIDVHARQGRASWHNWAANQEKDIRLDQSSKSCSGRAPKEQNLATTFVFFIHAV